MWESAMLDILLNVAPIVLFMGIVIYTLYKEYKKLGEYQRESEKENLETLKDLRNLLDGFFTKSDRDKTEIVEKVLTEAQNVRNHIDNRINLLEARNDKEK